MKGETPRTTRFLLGVEPNSTRCQSPFAARRAFIRPVALTRGEVAHANSIPQIASGIASSRARGIGKRLMSDNP
jgi:hypothetical protein